MRYLESCRRLLSAYDELEAKNIGERAEPRGWINVTTPVMFGRLHILPVVRGFLDNHPGIDIRLILLDRVVSLVDEGLDLAVRIGELPDSSLRAIRVGQIRRIVCGSPEYIARHGVPVTPRDLRDHMSSRALPSRRSRIAGRSTVRTAALPRRSFRA